MCSPPFISGKRHPRSWIEDRHSPFRLQERDWASHYEVSHFSVELAGDEPFAEVKAGKITILGNMRPIPRPAVPKSLGQPQSFVYSSTGKVDTIYSPDQRKPQAGLETDRAEIRCLLAGFSGYHNLNVRLPICYTIVLQAIAGSTRTFRRIGMMVTLRSEYNADGWDEVVDWLLAAESQEIYLV